jgi:putative ABC transport system permease protein
LISLLGHLELSIGQEFSLESQDRPALFLFDIQDDQTEPLKVFMAESQVPLQALSPMVRGKLVSVNEQAFKKEKQAALFETREEENESRFRQRMMNLSWATGLNASETLDEGVDFGEAKVPEGEVALSLEKRFAQRLSIELGDQLTFEVLGVPITGRVVNLRTVKWTSFRPNFFITFAPGALEDAPKSWLAAVGQMPAAEKAKLQNQLSRKFPNISAVDVGQLVSRMMELFTRLKKALQLMAVFAFLVGVVVVGAMAQDQVLRRQSEVMLEKVLGISPWRVTLMVLGEFLGLAFVAFTLGGLAGAVLAAVITVLVFEGTVIWSASLLLSITLGGMILVSIPLLLMANKIFTWRPAGLLQQP